MAYRNKDDYENDDTSLSSYGEDMFLDNGYWDNNCVSIFSYSNSSKDTDASLILFDSITKAYINTSGNSV